MTNQRLRAALAAMLLAVLAPINALAGAATLRAQRTASEELVTMQQFRQLVGNLP